MPRSLAPSMLYSAACTIALVVAGGAAAQPVIGAPPAQQIIADAPTPQPVVTVSASASERVANDRMHAVLRAEADNADAGAAASAVNTRIGKAMNAARAVSGVDVSNAGYSTYQVSEPNHPPRWRVVQSMALDGSDFASIAALVTRLQASGMLLSGLEFSVSRDARHAAENRLTGEAIRAWQQRAQAAAHGFGAGGWRAGRVSIQTSEGGGPRPMFRATAMAAAPAPVAVEGGESEVTVTVSGEAILDTVRAAR
ncbi:MAG: SIMPL domain-containing protein [Proteobacteria bacterium]|nr:SIMPL domain-containing protein [Pseudomonadota bacterium]